ncbi:protein Mabiki-like [Lucilia sericata]|uniref:protein Mabiki-like n=1 Tax=Lucilia sericata TaxID=13632 RepID=UPI0018A83CF1|nr:protein Mabiki-like [Lucilia sericata]
MSTLNIIPATTMEECFEYRHKKFDQSSQRVRSNSLSSSQGDYECIKVEIERLNDNTTATSSTSSYNINNLANESNLKRTHTALNSGEHNYDSGFIPEAKRPRTTSFGSSSTYSQVFSPLAIKRQTSTPLTKPSNNRILIYPSTSSHFTQISDDTLRSICKYHGNMVRKFPKKERSAKDQERRDKNTIACRMSRRVKKLEHIAIEEQYKEFSQQTFDIIEQSMRATAYLHELMQLTSSQHLKEVEPQTSAMLTHTPPKKPFTIDFLVGNEKSI